MKRLLVSLYDDSDTATAVMQSLYEEGLKPTEIECIESPPEEDHLYRRPLFTDGRGERIHVASSERALSNMGIPEDDVGEYLGQIQSGRSLVILRCDEAMAPTARDVMNRVPMERAIRAQTGQSAPVPEPEWPKPQESAEDSARQAGEAARRSDAEILKRLAEKYHDDEWLHSDAPTRPPRKSLEGLPVDDPMTDFAEFEPDFRRHYREHFASRINYSFEECATAYRFGLALGDELEDEVDWSAVEPEAARQWETTDHPPWETMRDAVRFGWAAARGEEEQYRSQSPSR